MQVRQRKKRMLLAIGCLLVVAVFLTAVAVDIVRYSKRDEKRPCDTVIVLGAGTWNGEVTPVFRERINHGIWLYQNGYATCLIFTGGKVEGNSTSDAYAAKQYAISSGVPETAILIEELSTITEENLSYAKALMEEHALETALMVSDPLHMKRAMLMAEDYGIEAYSSPTPTTMYRSAKTKIPFLVREEFFYIGYKFVRLLR